MPMGESRLTHPRPPRRTIDGYATFLGFLGAHAGVAGSGPLVPLGRTSELVRPISCCSSYCYFWDGIPSVPRSTGKRKIRPRHHAGIGVPCITTVLLNHLGYQVGLAPTSSAENSLPQRIQSVNPSIP